MLRDRDAQPNAFAIFPFTFHLIRMNCKSEQKQIQIQNSNWIMKKTHEYIYLYVLWEKKYGMEIKLGIDVAFISLIHCWLLFEEFCLHIFSTAHKSQSVIT